MNKAGFVDLVTSKVDLTKKDTEKVINATIESIIELLTQGEKVQFMGFGSFEVRTRNARQERNPKTGETVHVESMNVPVFKAGKLLKDSVNK